MKRCVKFLPLALFLLPLLSLGCNSASAGKIAFVSNFEQPGKHSFVYIMDEDGADQIKLSECFAPILEWSPDGKRIAFCCGLEPEICIADADGRNLSKVKLPISLRYMGSALSWSPDGTELAIVGLPWPQPPGSSFYKTDIYAINVENCEAKKLTERGDISIRHLSWSPDGKQIAFLAVNRDSPDYTYLLCVMDAGGSNQRVLLTIPWTNDEISWSPDGKRIMYVAGFGEGHIEEIYVVDVEDGARINLTNSPDVYDRNPSWSPDGKRIAFCSGNFTGAQIYIMDADGSNVVKLTDKELGCHPVFVHNDIRLFFSASGPSWSPDGKRIVFYGSTVCRPDPSLGVGGWDSIFIVDIDSRQVLDLIATGPGDYYRPVWSPR